jgi:hypothetical protein
LKPSTYFAQVSLSLATFSEVDSDANDGISTYPGGSGNDFGNLQHPQQWKLEM